MLVAKDSLSHGEHRPARVRALFFLSLSRRNAPTANAVGAATGREGSIGKASTRRRLYAASGRRHAPMYQAVRDMACIAVAYTVMAYLGETPSPSLGTSRSSYLQVVGMLRYIRP